MGAVHRTIRVFLASPGDLANARSEFIRVLKKLNRRIGRHARVEFKPLVWEQQYYPVGPRSQDTINQMVDCCDVFILAMGRRWGQSASDVRPPYSSYTEEEYYRAARRRERGQPAPLIYVFFKNVDHESALDEQYAQVVSFKAELEKSRRVFLNKFTSSADFARQVYARLIDYLVNPPATMPAVSGSGTRQISLGRDEAVRAAAQAHAMFNTGDQAAQDKTTHDAELMEQVIQAARDNQVARARQLAEQGDTLADLLDAVDLFMQAGDLDEVERLLDRCFYIAGYDTKSAGIVDAYIQYGVLFRMRGDYTIAERTLHRALETSRTLGYVDGQIRSLSEIGVVFRCREELARALEFYNRALDLAKASHRNRDEATQYRHIGVIHALRNERKAAESHLASAIQIFEKESDTEGVMRAKSDLAWLAREHRDFASAYSLYEEVLRFAEKCARADLVANAKANLGLVEHQRGNNQAARKLWKEADTKYQSIGMKTDMDWVRQQLRLLRSRS